MTDGNWGKVSGGPNRSLTDMNHIFGHGYMFICAARYMADYPEEDYRFYNRGISGNRVADLKARWQQDALEIDPDILSVLVGVNDLLDVYNKTDGPQEVDTARFEADYRDILDRSRAQNPEVRIVLAEPFILPVGMWQEHYTHWRAQCDRLGAVVKSWPKNTTPYSCPIRDYSTNSHTTPGPRSYRTGCGTVRTPRRQVTKRWPNYGCRE